MEDIFFRRMQLALGEGYVGSGRTKDSDILMNHLFDVDQNYRKGIIYDWEMSPLSSVDFKFEKVKTFKAEGYEVEYYVQFRPGYQPEVLFKDKFHKNDGKERFGFYIDVYDSEKDITEKWMIVGKDHRVTFDRYNVLRCNWCIEWVDEDKNYHNCVCVLRMSDSNDFKMVDTDDLGGSSIEGNYGVIIPTREDAKTILYGQRFIITDTDTRPQTFMVTRVKDTSPLGISKLYMTQALFNRHIDYIGVIDDDTSHEFVAPISDLPDGFGGNYHMICSCIKTKALNATDASSTSSVNEWYLICSENKLYYKGTPVKLTAVPSIEGTAKDFFWRFYVDDIQYEPEELTDYLIINIDDLVVNIECINKKLAKYIIRVVIADEDGSYIKMHELEVSM